MRRSGRLYAFWARIWLAVARCGALGPGLRAVHREAEPGLAERVARAVPVASCRLLRRHVMLERVAGMRVLLTEGSSLMARQVVTCLGPVGHHLEVLDPDPLCLARFSRWVRRVHRCPPGNTDPLGYVQALGSVVDARSIEVVLPTHEQAWLLAVTRPLLSPQVRVAVATGDAWRSGGATPPAFSHWGRSADHPSNHCPQEESGWGPQTSGRDVLLQLAASYTKPLTDRGIELACSAWAYGARPWPRPGRRLRPGRDLRLRVSVTARPRTWR